MKLRYCLRWMPLGLFSGLVVVITGSHVNAAENHFRPEPLWNAKRLEQTNRQIPGQGTQSLRGLEKPFGPDTEATRNRLSKSIGTAPTSDVRIYRQNDAIADHQEIWFHGYAVTPHRVSARKGTVAPVQHLSDFPDASEGDSTRARYIIGGASPANTLLGQPTIVVSENHATPAEIRGVLEGCVLDAHGSSLCPQGNCSPTYSLDSPRRDELLCDGGDAWCAAEVDVDWTVRGLDVEDTIAHYDTIEGRTEVQASNSVCIYTPRFAAVRKVMGVRESDISLAALSAAQPLPAVSGTDYHSATAVHQPLMPGRHLSVVPPLMHRERLRGVGLKNASIPIEYTDKVLPHEDFVVLRTGEYDQSEGAKLLRYVDSAQVWSNNDTVAVMIDRKHAHVEVGRASPQTTHQYSLPPGKPRLRLIKLASQYDAKPGDIVEFVLRFDNIGDQTLENMTLMDSLTSRLQYVEESTECTLDTVFATQDNGEDSLVLRWEISEPLPVGNGGTVRFKCRVR